jgi:hypothetical protein
MEYKTPIPNRPPIVVDTDQPPAVKQKPKLKPCKGCPESEAWLKAIEASNDEKRTKAS